MPTGSRTSPTAGPRLRCGPVCAKAPGVMLDSQCQSCVLLLPRRGRRRGRKEGITEHVASDIVGFGEGWSVDVDRAVLDGHADAVLRLTCRMGWGVHGSK